MLTGIDRSGTTTQPAATTKPSPATKPVAGSEAGGVGSGTTSRQDAVVVSITTTVMQTEVTASVSDSESPSLAQQLATRGLDALQQISQAQTKSADTMKGFLRQKLDGLKKQEQVLRLLGTDALQIAKDSVRVAQEVAKTVRDYAADTIAGNPGGSAGVTDKQAQAQAQALQTQADAAPLADAGGDTPADAPTDPDDRFFYDAYRLLHLVKKTLVETQRIDTRQHGLQHAKDFKKLNRRESDLEQAVTDAYTAMKTGGDLKTVDALIAGTPSESF